ncbi:hypothetical protein Aduo_003673 [Ancylostoma duodenale]
MTPGTQTPPPRVVCMRVCASSRRRVCGEFFAIDAFITTGRRVGGDAGLAASAQPDGPSLSPLGSRCHPPRSRWPSLTTSAGPYVTTPVSEIAARANNRGRHLKDSWQSAKGLW